MSTDAERLRRRAEKLAARIEAAGADHEREPVLVVRLGPERFAIRMTAVDRVLPLRNVCPVPRAAAAVRGVMAVRGEIRTIYDLDRLLDQPASDLGGDDQRAVILRGTRPVGVRVDAVEAIDFVDPREAAGRERALVQPTSSGPLILLENLTSLVAKVAGET